MRPLSRRAEGCPTLCAHCLVNGASLPPPLHMLRGQSRYRHVHRVFARWLCTRQRWGPCTESHAPYTCSGPVTVLGFRDPGCTHILIHTHVYTGLPPLPCSSGASHVIFPLLSVVMELPVLLERLPNMIIGTPAMIKKKFQIRATMP